MLPATNPLPYLVVMSIYQSQRFYWAHGDCIMVQFSIYARRVSSKERVARFEKHIANTVPERGNRVTSGHHFMPQA